MARTEAHGSDGNLLERLLTRIENWARGRELDQFDAEELAHIAHDIGIDAATLSRLATTESDASRLLYARLEGLGLTMAEIEASGVGSARDMERTCALCADRALCAHDLEARPEADEWRRLCPNRWAFDEMERLKSAKA